jgi:F-type H+-transporting ATPase subunit beta
MPLEAAIMIEAQEGLTWERWNRIATTVEDGGFDALFRSDHLTVLQRFFAQPFFVAEPYTKRPGAFVPRAEAIAACAAIADGLYDDIPEEAFYFTGGIDEVLARAGRPR